MIVSRKFEQQKLLPSLRRNINYHTSSAKCNTHYSNKYLLHLSTKSLDKCLELKDLEMKENVKLRRKVNQVSCTRNVYQFGFVVSLTLCIILLTIIYL